MGQLFYGNASESIEIPDRLLAHLKVLAATKLRRSESFTLTWKHVDGSASGRSTIWLQPSIPLRFVFDSAEPEKLDSNLLTEMAKSATSSAGLVVDLAEYAPAAAPAAGPASLEASAAPALAGELATAA
ncbi:DUF7882 family protein [Microbacterium oleivorans]|uniref:DUF7882 domain-containing protein n=1 Tax=Microbacterium oleivorans TaxID=273677 RepID=A0A7D5EXT8_9MICO|nr:hypothetical protein [Microbacterium oleivorans]QLD12646.1 hypothetical protein HW566_13195 [Microbacterium oleivorans]